MHRRRYIRVPLSAVKYTALFLVVFTGATYVLHQMPFIAPAAAQVASRCK